MSAGFGSASDTGLAYGVFSCPAASPAASADERRLGVSVGERILDLAAAFEDQGFAQPSLNAFMARGPAGWAQARARIEQLLAQPAAAEPHLITRAETCMQPPFDVADFVDFNGSLQHTRNVGQILRPQQDPVRENWLRMPVGYHGRAGTVVPSGTPIVRPHGQRRNASGDIAYEPTEALDVEVELGFVVGVPSQLGQPVPGDDFAKHVFGAVIVLDWSARDIQAFEHEPLGPFLGKSFATTISSWIVPLEALRDSRVAPPHQDPSPPAYLQPAEHWALDIEFALCINENVVSRPRFASMYWSPAQQFAHLTANGASLRTGDLFASGTVSDDANAGCLMELSRAGSAPVSLADGSTRAYLHDGDVVSVSAVAHFPDAASRAPLWLGEATGEVRPAIRRGGDPSGGGDVA